MNGRDFLDVARENLVGGTEAHFRAAAGRAYYALMLEGHDVLERWGFTPAPRENVHHYVRIKFFFAADADLKRIGNDLTLLSRLRNEADYKTKTLGNFATANAASQAVSLSGTCIVLLDAIEADPVCRAAAVASIRP